MPYEVLLKWGRGELSPGALHVYLAVAAHRRGVQAEVGDREVAAWAGVERERGVRRYIEELRVQVPEWFAVLRREPGRRSVYLVVYPRGAGTLAGDRAGAAVSGPPVQADGKVVVLGPPVRRETAGSGGAMTTSAEELDGASGGAGTTGTVVAGPPVKRRRVNPPQPPPFQGGAGAANGRSAEAEATRHGASRPPKGASKRGSDGHPPVAVAGLADHQVAPSPPKAVKGKGPTAPASRPLTAGGSGMDEPLGRAGAGVDAPAGASLQAALARVMAAASERGRRRAAD